MKKIQQQNRIPKSENVPYNYQKECLKPQHDTSYKHQWIMECIYITYVGFSRPWVMGSSQKGQRLQKNYHFDVTCDLLNDGKIKHDYQNHKYVL